jgi:hypothetical protein
LYKEINYNSGFSYRGYFINNIWVGPGIFTRSDGSQEIGEWHNGALNGCGREKGQKGGLNYWGEYSNNKREGFGTVEDDNSILR